MDVAVLADGGCISGEQGSSTNTADMRTSAAPSGAIAHRYCDHVGRESGTKPQKLGSLTEACDRWEDTASACGQLPPLDQEVLLGLSVHARAML